VTPWDIRYDPADRAFLDRDPDGRFRFRLWTEPGLGDGLLVVRSGGVRGYPLDLPATTSRFSYWEKVVSLEPGCEYTFAFRSAGGEGVYRVPGGITNAVERLDRWALPDLAPIGTPHWAQGAVIYQIFPDRFASSGTSPAPIITDPWGSPPHHRRFQGGDLAGITARLDYLAGLGTEAIYLNPIFLSPSNHRYDTIDYYQVDPSLGGNQALADLVARSHALGIRVIVDSSFNHCHPRFFAFADLIEQGPASPYRNWFVVHDWPVRLKVRRPLSGWQAEWVPIWAEQTGMPVEEVDEGPAVEPSYEAWYGVATMPRINLANPETRAYMMEVGAYWVREFGIDGWRMDVARYVDPDFWNDFRTAVKGANRDAYLLAEFMGDASPWLQGDRFDATMNYTFRDICRHFLADERADGAETIEGLARLLAQYAWPVTLVNQNLIGSHDTARFRTVAGGDLWRLRLATVLQMTFPGAPGIYYGDEIGLEGGKDPGSRNAFPSDLDATGCEPYETIRSLAALRRRHPSLRVGEWRPLEGRGNLLAFTRGSGRRRLAIAINRGRRALSMRLPETGRLLWGSATIEPGILRLPAREAAVVGLGR
jgi:neopullulanase